jgi:hypothetical protein
MLTYLFPLALILSLRKYIDSTLCTCIINCVIHSACNWACSAQRSLGELGQLGATCIPRSSLFVCIFLEIFFVLVGPKSWPGWRCSSVGVAVLWLCGFVLITFLGIIRAFWVEKRTIADKTNVFFPCTLAPA